MRKIISYFLAAIMTVATFATPASAQFSGGRASVAAAAQDSSGVEQVQHRRWREHRGYRGHRGYDRHRGYRGHRGYYRNRGYYGGRGYYRNRGYYGHRRYGYRRHNNGAVVAAGILGLAAGAAIANSNTGNGSSYCASRFRSYDPRSGTYLGYDGRRHACP